MLKSEECSQASKYWGPHRSPDCKPANEMPICIYAKKIIQISAMLEALSIDYTWLTKVYVAYHRKFKKAIVDYFYRFIVICFSGFSCFLFSLNESTRKIRMYHAMKVPIPYIMSEFSI